jgi:hypothetical protein
MTKTTRHLMMTGLMLTALAGAARIAEGADETGLTVSPHVRSSNPEIGTLIVLATEQSATFRGMVETINASGSLVYVEKGACGSRVRACLIDVTLAGAYRILWVKVDTRKADWDLMGSIGHELRHSIEVLGALAVTSRAAMYFFYTREGSIGSSGAFETTAAIHAGMAVRDEVRKFRKALRGNRT